MALRGGPRLSEERFESLSTVTETPPTQDRRPVPLGGTVGEDVRCRWLSRSVKVHVSAHGATEGGSVRPDTRPDVEEAPLAAWPPPLSSLASAGKRMLRISIERSSASMRTAATISRTTDCRCSKVKSSRVSRIAASCRSVASKRTVLSRFDFFFRSSNSRR